jgi:hypothetical protein
MNKKPAGKDLSKKHHDDIMTALDNQLKMFLHLERMVEKIAAKVDALFELVGSANAVESAGPNYQSSSHKGYQGKAMQLTNPNLIKLYDRVVRMEVTGRERNKFHNAFIHKYRLLLLFYQKHGHPLVNMKDDKTLYEFVKNQKTNLRLYQDGQGPYAKEPRYVKYVQLLGITYGS